MNKKQESIPNGINSMRGAENTKARAAAAASEGGLPT